MFFWILDTVSAWVMIPPSKLQKSNFFYPTRHKKNKQVPQGKKLPDNSNMFNMFFNNTAYWFQNNQQIHLNS